MPKSKPPAAPHENRLLARLPPEDYKRLLPRLKLVPLEFKQILYEARSPMDYAYFPSRGVVSAVAVMEDGRAIEVATVGDEGMVGLPLLVGAKTTANRVIVQVPGEALRMETRVFQEEMKLGGPLYGMVQRYTQAMINQISQSTVCNHRHSVEERMCRWLLMSHDRGGADEFPLTHEFLAQMLGVCRPTLTSVAGTLQKAGLINYHRGRITVLDRKGLEAASCECYEVVAKELDRLLG